jgi:hypothetical protein
VNDVVLNSLTSVDICYSLDTTHDYSPLVATNVNPTDDNDVTVLTSNCTTAHHNRAMLIKPSHVVANTDAFFVFIMDDTPTNNKWPATHPIQISLPDRRKVTSINICDTTIPKSPITLTGHIVPEMIIASLLGVRILCKAGCVIVFDDKTCCICYRGKLILMGYKDPTSDLWTLPIGQEELWTTAALNLEDPRAHKILLSPHEEHNNVPACAAQVQGQTSAYATMRGGHGVSKLMPP